MFLIILLFLYILWILIISIMLYQDIYRLVYHALEDLSEVSPFHSLLFNVKIAEVTKDYFIKEGTNEVFFHPIKLKEIPSKESLEKRIKTNVFLAMLYARKNLPLNRWVRNCDLSIIDDHSILF